MSTQFLSEAHKTAVEWAQLSVPVFVCHENAKEPATTHGFYDATTDLDTINAWFTKNPNYNLAELNVLKQIQAGQNIFTDVLKNYDLQSIITEINNNISQIPSIFVELYKFMSLDLSCISDISSSHNRQDLKTMLRLKNL